MRWPAGRATRHLAARLRRVLSRRQIARTVFDSFAPQLDLSFAAAVYGLYRYYRYLRKRELKTTPQPPISVLELPQGSVPASGNGEKSPAASEPKELPPLPK